MCNLYTFPVTQKIHLSTAPQVRLYLPCSKNAIVSSKDARFKLGSEDTTVSYKDALSGSLQMSNSKMLLFNSGFKDTTVGSKSALGR